MDQQIRSITRRNVIHWAFQTTPVKCMANGSGWIGGRRPSPSPAKPSSSSATTDT